MQTTKELKHLSYKTMKLLQYVSKVCCHPTRIRILNAQRMLKDSIEQLKFIQYSLKTYEYVELDQAEAEVLVKAIDVLFWSKLMLLFKKSSFNKNDLKNFERMSIKFSQQFEQPKINAIQRTFDVDQTFQRASTNSLLEHIDAVKSIIKQDEQRLIEDPTNADLQRFVESTKEYLHSLISSNQIENLNHST